LKSLRIPKPSKVPLRSLLCRLGLVTSVSFASQGAHGQLLTAPDLLGTGFRTIPLVSSENFRDSVIADAAQEKLITDFCSAVDLYFRKYKWDDKPCGTIPWRASLRTASGHPLIYASFGEGKETSLVLGGVHPDELTPIPMAFRFARHLADNPGLYAGSRVIIAPLVNPDGFLRSRSSRTNANGVDLNRNFFTADWYGRAKKWWADRREKSLSHFPGWFPNSEIETLFQIKLVDEYAPDKILSIHAPLGFLDYDGPGSDRPRALTPSEAKAKRLVHTISENSRNYRIVDYSFYPGSLGNYAGNERNIPTVTLELETTNPAKVEEYWQQFLPGLTALIKYPFKNVPPAPDGNASRFFGDFNGIQLKEARKQI